MNTFILLLFSVKALTSQCTDENKLSCLDPIRIFSTVLLRNLALVYPRVFTNFNLQVLVLIFYLFFPVDLSIKHLATEMCFLPLMLFSYVAQMFRDTYLGSSAA